MARVIDLYRHEHWADAEHWRAIEAHAPAMADQPLRDRLYHIHLVQHAFLSTIHGKPFAPPTFDDAAGLKAWARQYHDEMIAYVAAATNAELERALAIPWFKDPDLTITVDDALTQCAMHSHYHRGQNATRLRDLGGQPPFTDFIVWLWRGRPDPAW
jgi:uncharacterized damage-inducible protein DinB